MGFFFPQPTDWNEYTNDQGKSYWYNAKLGRTVTDKPAELVEYGKLNVLLQTRHIINNILIKMKSGSELGQKSSQNTLKSNSTSIDWLIDWLIEHIESNVICIDWLIDWLNTLNQMWFELIDWLIDWLSKP